MSSKYYVIIVITSVLLSIDDINIL